MIQRCFHECVPRSAIFLPLFLVFICIGTASGNKEGYYGKFIGRLSQLHHGVSGDVFAVDARTLHLRNFNYDGEGPAAYFYAGSTKGPGVGGFRIRDERGTTNVLPRYRNKHITISLPEGKTLNNIRWFSVWCDEFSVNFGDVKIPKNLDFPKPQKINGLAGVHGVSSEPIVIVDAQTLLVPGFSYDGEAPDAKFWVGRGPKPSPQGIRIPDENGKEVPLRRYDRKTIVLTLPGDLTIFDIGHFGVWCEAFTVDFGHVQIPAGLNIPPSLKMLGVSPQSKLNCEVLWDDFAYEVRWAVAGDSIVLQLVARLENNEYMSFGISGDNGRSRMVGGDVVVAWVDKESLKGYAVDYYLDAKSQCSGGRGSCPDENIASGTDSVRLLNAALVNGYSIVTFQRSLKDQDELDKPVLTNGTQPVIWAIGPLNSRKEVSYHSLANRRDIFIDFGRSPKWNCPTPESVSDDAVSESSSDADREVPTVQQDSRKQDPGRRESLSRNQVPTPAPAPKSDAWDIPSIKCYEPEDGVFYAQMGPTGGKHGYSAITGHVGWGISWYINGLLIPEINVVRGRTYTFIVEGGLDPETPARYHPFYITDDPVGGYQHKTPQERANIQIFAGAVQNRKGEVRPTGVGRLCNWTPDPNQPPADEFSSFGAYQRTLRLECDPGNPGIIQWTVEKDTPDTVYYQCYTHRYLGWKINVHDHCEGEAAGSEPVPSIAEAPLRDFDFQATEPEASESINYEVRVKPDDKFLTNVFHKNQTTVGPNEFLRYNEMYKHRPETLIQYQVSEKNAPTSQTKLNVEELVEKPNSKHQEAETLPIRLSPALAIPIRSQFDHSHWSLYGRNNSETAPSANKVLIYPDVNNLPISPIYAVSDYLSAGISQQVFQDFQLVPASVDLPNLTPTKELTHLVTRPNIPRPEIALVQAVAEPKPIENHKEFSKFHLRGNPHKENKIKKINQNPGVSSKLTSGQSLGLPSNQHGSLHFNGPSRPTPFPAFRPPRPLLAQHKLSRRPASAGSQKTQLRFHAKNSDRYRPEAGFEPEHFINLNSKKSQQFKFQRYEHKLQPGTFPGQEPRPSNLVGVSIAARQNVKDIPFARNSGFDPESVQVEGGFKPILNTGIAPAGGVEPIDRIDADSNEDPGRDVATRRLSATIDSQTSFVLARDKTLANSEKNRQIHNETTNFFEKPQPQTFEPMFIPSFPDDGFEKKKENLDKESQGIKLKKNIFRYRYRYRDPQESNHAYGKIKSDGSVIPPLKPEYSLVLNKQKTRSDAADSHPDPDSDPDSFKVKNETLVRGDGAKNIFEVIKAFERNEAAPSGKEGAPSEEAEGSADEIAMADERKDFYLPPEAGRFLSYDGKLVKADPAPALPEAHPVPDVSKLPRLVPFRGAVPPIGQPVRVGDLPQLRTSKLARHDILPPTRVPAILSKALSNSQGDATRPDLAAKRNRRSPDHLPGHEGHHRDHEDHHHDHDHDGNDDGHHHHDQQQQQQSHSRSATCAANFFVTGLLAVVFPFLRMRFFLSLHQKPF